jgi:hypothetical protein
MGQYGAKTQKKRAKKAAKHLPAYMQDVAFTKARNRVRHKLGKFGAASEVRHIDPAEYQAVNDDLK